ncbi:MAG TPA: septum formation initiator family protein [Terriglobales bacterium]|nr:septum formation initiator family protein [Terriglobales bacterium]
MHRLIENPKLHHLLDRLCQVFYSSRRKLATAAVFALVLFLGFHVIFGANGMMVYTHKRSEYQRLIKETQQLDEENQKLTKEVEDLRTDPKAIEKEAREQLHYTKKGEVIYLLPQKPADQPPKDASAKK